ncbi:MAG: 4-hydroxythreonine-4-phosphate dehydrogenase PdxA [Phycisphaerales bacterium]
MPRSTNTPGSTIPVIAVTLGDPGGIGPEVVAKALADGDLRRRAAYRLLGPEAALRAAADRAGIAPFWVRVAFDAPPPSSGAVVVLDDPGKPPFKADHTREGGEISFACVERAIVDALRPTGDPRRVDAIVTGPISKKAWSLAGHGEFPGHTELLAARCGSARYAMMFLTPRLRVILATTHLPLMRVGDVLTTARVREVIALGAEACQRLGVARPRLAVCGLNPHAGEDGLLGTEDRDVIAPAVAAAAQTGIDCRGPFPGDTVFNAAVRSDFDLVVAMYHDQGLIPVKLLDRDAAVNVTVGLPIIRTSPDHGTAFDIAGRNKAAEGSMKTAIETAVRMAASPPQSTLAPRPPG